jgi:23S rRNA (cytosine1962-C5)-methyltransferase
VRVIDPQGRPLGAAHYSSTSQISLRLLSRHVEPIDKAFLRTRIETAIAYRQRIVDDSEAYRIVHAEGDLLPGLIVDRYADFLVLQLLDQGMDRLAQDLVAY